MGIDPVDLRDLIIIPVCRELNLYSYSAINLLLGTAAHESHMGTWLKQINGPALGIYQMEPQTLQDLILNSHRGRQVLQWQMPIVGYDLLNPLYATAACRLQYTRFGEPLPHKDDRLGLAKYWKKYWNTEAGSGTTSGFLTSLETYAKSALL